MRFICRKTAINFIQDDITRQDVECLVNAANSSLAGGGGVDGAIHRAGGPAIMKELDVVRKQTGGCPTGEAVITSGGILKARYVIHTVGPIYNGRAGERELLTNCYKNSLRLAHQNGVKTMAFPSISTGVYRYPIEKAAPVALEAVIREIPRFCFSEIRFVLFSTRDYAVYLSVAQAMATSGKLKPAEAEWPDGN